MTYLIKAFFTSAFLLGALTSAHSATVSLDYPFDDTVLSGGFSYDDTTATSLSGPLTGFTAYTPISLNVSYASGGTTLSWTLADYMPFRRTGFTFMPTIDPYGSWETSEISIAPIGWANSTFVNAQGATLTFLTCLSNVTIPNSWCGQQIMIQDFNGNLLTRSAYETSTSVIPIPAAIWLFNSGLIGLVGFARRKN